MRLTEEQYQALMLSRPGMTAAQACLAEPGPEVLLDMNTLQPAPTRPTPLQRMQALGRMKAGRMNKTEAAYAQYLEGLKVTGEVLWYEFEAITLRLADRTRFTPDFAVLLATGALQMRECKGYWTDDAKAKTKIAAEKFPFEFVAVYKLRAKQGGGWRHDVIGR